MINLSKLKINGRYIFKDDHLFIFNGGSSISFKTRGTNFVISLESSPIPTYYYIIIDRDYDSKIKLDTSKPYKYSFNDKGVHYVDVIKANEANDCTLKLLDLTIDGELLDYDHIYDKRVKVYGDSTVAGFGILGHDGVGSYLNSDSVKDFVYQALYKLNYEMDILSSSGWGLAFSIYTCPKHRGIIDFIDKVAVNKLNDWKDHSIYDLLIISLGTNDDSYIQETPHLFEINKKEYINKYKELIDHELAINPNIKILMVYGTLKEENAYYLNEETYEALKPLYKNLYIHKFNGDNSAISHHAYVDHHSLMSKELEQVIKQIFNK